MSRESAGLNFEHAVHTPQKIERLFWSGQYEDCLRVLDQLLSFPNLDDETRELLIFQKCRCFGFVVLGEDCSQDTINSFLTFSKSVIDRLHLETRVPLDENERLLCESHLRVDRMKVFYELRCDDSALNEIQVILHINPLSPHAYEAFCYRAFIFAIRFDLENMKRDLDFALQLREKGVAVGRESLIDYVAAYYETIMHNGINSINLDNGQTTVLQDFSGILARKRAVNNDQIPYDPTWSNEQNFLVVLEVESGIVFVDPEVTDAIPVLCSYRKRIDALVHFAVDEKQKEQIFGRLSSVELARNAILWASDAIKSPLLLFALRHPQMSLEEFDVKSLFLPQRDTSLLYPSEGLIIAFHLIVDCEICSDCLIRWVVENGSIVHCDRQKIEKDELMQCVHYFPSLFDRSGRLEFQSPRFHQQKNVCRYLHNVLLGGSDRFFVGQTHVTFVPDRDLFRVPFGCLLDEAGSYLIEKCSFSVSSSLRMIGENARQKEHVIFSSRLCSVLLCGDAADSNSGLIQCVKALCSDPIVVVSHSQFTPMNVQECCSLFRPQVVHLISHGSSEENLRTNDILDQFQLSGSLSCSNGTELTARSVAESFDLQGTDLVYLNACQLAGGHTQALGVLGFNRAIFQAGCPSVISALWNVYVRASTAISHVFYTNYLSGQYDKSESLRLAILSLFGKSIQLGNTRFSSFRDFPVFWAPYQLFGNRV